MAIGMKTIDLCADDFGVNPGVSRGIVKLAQQGRLSAASCMVNMPAFSVHAPELLALKGAVKIGLHFNLTQGALLSAPDRNCFSLHELLIKTHLNSLKFSFVAQELKQQLDRFIEVMGCMPDFIDGHQHVHQFPMIRQELLALYAQKLHGSRVAIRSTCPAITAPTHRLKAKVLALTGGKALHTQLVQAAIPHNDFFSGIYDFAPETDYRQLFRGWLRAVPENTLIMCHPGEESAEIDAIAPTRLIEMNYLSSDDFIADCNEFGIRLRTCGQSQIN